MKKIIDKYKELCIVPSDINEHLPTLCKYASMCDHVTEFGVRSVISTFALLAGSPKMMVSYDIEDICMDALELEAKGTVRFRFLQGDTTKITISPTDLLFIDTLHNYRQLNTELELHASKVGKYIIMHDTTTFGEIGESYKGLPEKGLWLAIEEFLVKNPKWN